MKERLWEFIMKLSVPYSLLLTKLSSKNKYLKLFQKKDNLVRITLNKLLIYLIL